ncbi:SusC/RagA family TonB-linked outer membrane protein [uncultured Duncaniella sp.]|uniref:SusC/RagA family TonB-linked outer membrane protein n=1 Tax=uncultured Duncaniella sp. TaxID=2768039 RepID=UPI002676EC83|nr:SusC/RagA family TonB-linked outer membrane protein [uncultured Duncaniella sp.]MCI9171750.1 SusC/RagA family TonB-linked outer membrane protein [Muribaculaceae bacterium]
MKPRLLWLLALVICVHISALAQSQYSATFRNASAEEAIQILKKSTGYDFVYQKDLLKGNGSTVNGIFNNASLDDLLSATVNQQLGLNYKILGNSVSLSADASPSGPTASVITGTVTGEDGEPLPGVTILLKSNPKHGTSTDIDGRYSFSIPRGTKSPVLVYSFVGMEPKELAVRKSSTMNVTLRENPETLHDVVVTGIFRRNKELATGASTTISAKELKQVGNQNLLQSLRTLDPSIKLVDNNLAGSNPNALPEVELRGANGITDLDANYTGNPNQPLFILDGFETTLQRVMDMDPNRVASITILKDASAAALYGSRSANGVIVIETLAPEGGRIRVNYAGDYAVVTPDLSDYDMLNAREKLQLQVDAGHFDATDNTNYNTLQDYYQRLKRNVEEGVNTDWLAQPVHTVFEHRHNLRLEGGDNTVRYSINLTARNAPGVMKGSGRTGYEGGMFLSYRVKGLIFKNDLQLTYNDADNSPYGKFSTYTAMNPYQRPTDADGKLVKQFDKDAPRYFTGYNNNPLYDAGLNITDSEDYFNFVNNFSLEWNITDFLTLMARVSITRQTGETNYFLPAQHSSFAEMGDPVSDPEEYMRRGSFTWGTSKMFSVLGDINLRYGQSFGKHSLYAVMGVNMSQTTSETRTIQAEGFPSQNMVDISFAKQYYKDSRPSSTYNINRLAGILLTANYAYDSKYLLDASLKYDGSSQFGSNQRYAPVWSVGAGWNIHKESFLEGGVFSQLKLRGSYGVTASQNFSPYQAICKYQYNIAHQYAGIIPATMMGLGNNDLKWQQTKVINGGTDIGLFNDRLSFTFDIYKRRTTNLLASVTVAPSLGFPSYTENIGETENNGYEFSLRYMFLRDVSRRLYWSVNFSGNHNSNKITKISNAMKKRNEDIIDKAYREGTTTPLLLYEEGNSVTSIYAVRSLGIDPSNGQEMYLTKNGIKTYTWNSADQVCVGDTRPDMEGVFGTSLNWGDFSFSANFRYSFGGQVYNTTLADRVENANLYQNVDRRVYDQRWRKPGDVTMFKDVKDTSRTRQTSRFVQDNDYISCESISLGYDITSRKVLGFIGAERLRVTGYLNDIFRWSTVKQERGLDYPFARRYAFSLNVSF